MIETLITALNVALLLFQAFLLEKFNKAEALEKVKAAQERLDHLAQAFLIEEMDFNRNSRGRVRDLQDAMDDDIPKE